jgi:hypothetical protein
VRALAAGEDPHYLGPALELVAVRARAEQSGQLGNVCYVDAALAVGTTRVRGGAVSAALADLAAGIDGDLPGGLGILPIASRSRPPSAQPTE